MLAYITLRAAGRGSIQRIHRPPIILFIDDYRSKAASPATSPSALGVLGRLRWLYTQFPRRQCVRDAFRLARAATFFTSLSARCFLLGQAGVIIAAYFDARQSALKSPSYCRHERAQPRREARWLTTLVGR